MILIRISNQFLAICLNDEIWAKFDQIQEAVEAYFGELILQNEPTIYDHLVLTSAGQFYSGIKSSVSRIWHKSRKSVFPVPINLHAYCLPSALRLALTTRATCSRLISTQAFHTLIMSRVARMSFDGSPFTRSRSARVPAQCIRDQSGRIPEPGLPWLRVGLPAA